MWNDMKCQICGKENAHEIMTIEIYKKNEELYAIEGVPMMSCQDCGESYYTATTLHILEELKTHATDGREQVVKIFQFKAA